MSSSLNQLQVRHLGRVPFLEAWEMQREIHAAVAGGDMPDTLLLLEHDPVYTAGRRTQPEDRPLDGTPSSTSTAAGGSPGTDPANWSGIRSCICPSPWMSWAM